MQLLLYVHFLRSIPNLFLIIYVDLMGKCIQFILIGSIIKEHQSKFGKFVFTVFQLYFPLDNVINRQLLWTHAATIGTLTDLGFLWFREFYLESSRVIQVQHFTLLSEV